MLKFTILVIMMNKGFFFMDSDKKRQLNELHELSILN